MKLTRMRRYISSTETATIDNLSDVERMLTEHIWLRALRNNDPDVSAALENLEEVVNRSLAKSNEC